MQHININEWVVYVHEVHIQPVVVKADSKEAAQKLAADGQGDYEYFSAEYSRTIGNPQNWNVEPFSDLNRVARFAQDVVPYGVTPTWHVYSPERNEFYLGWLELNEAVDTYHKLVKEGAGLVTLAVRWEAADGTQEEEEILKHGEYYPF